MTDSLTKKPIVIFSARYLPSTGGVEFFTANLGHALAMRGCDVLVVTTEPADDTAGDARVTVGTGSMEVMRLHSFGPQRMPFVRRDAHYRACMWRLRGLGDFHALVNTRFYDLSTVAARLCQKLGIRPVLIDHGTGYIAFPSAALSAVAKVAEHAITANLKRSPIDFYGVSRDASAWLRTFGIVSCGEIHNALDGEGFVGEASGRDFRAEYGVEAGALCVCFAGRLLPEKGADTIVGAARLLAGRAPVHFFVAGRGPMEGELAAADAELKNLSYVGVLSHPDLAALLLSCDVFCLPTRYKEGLPTSLLEAGACGCALVASHAGGVDEIVVSAEHGIVLEDPTAEAVAETVRELAGDGERLELLKRNAQAYVCERFSWEATVEELLAAFARAEASRG